MIQHFSLKRKDSISDEEKFIANKRSDISPLKLYYCIVGKSAHFNSISFLCVTYSRWLTCQLKNCTSPEIFLLTESYRATHRKYCIFIALKKLCTVWTEFAKFANYFSIFLLCQIKIPDEQNTRCVYVLGKNINKPLVHSYQPLLA